MIGVGAPSEMGRPRSKACGALVLVLIMAMATSAHSAFAYAPQKGDYFDYSETITVNDGQGSYAGYTDQAQVTGVEQMNSVSGSNVSASYSVSYQYSNDQGNHSSSSYGGSYVWSSSSYTYLNGTDDQVGYSKPIYVWFAMDPSLLVGSRFYVLNTQFTVLSADYSLQLPTEGDKYVQTVETEGTGQYQRNDSYGIFEASYTWYAYFDPATGYIVGYSYLEHDTGQYQGQAGSFTYTDLLYVTSTSYGLTTVGAPNAFTATVGSDLYLVVILVLLVFVLIIAVLAYRAGRRRRDSLPRHSSAPAVPRPQPETKVDLGSTPPREVVIREVAMVNCKFCGTLIPTTADTCPQCGGPQR